MNNMSQTISKLIAALSQAQREMGEVLEDRRNDFLKSSYASFVSYLNAAGPALHKYELCVIQRIMYAENNVTLLTMLAHSSGEFIESVAPLMFPSKDSRGNFDPQKFGTYVTYMRRYSYAAMLGLIPGAREDDDGETAKNDFRDGAHAVERTISISQAEELEGILEGHEDIKDRILSAHSIVKLSQLNVMNYADVFEKVMKNIKIKERKNGN